jgi:hypothetical protein
VTYTAGRWFSLGTPVSSTNKTDRHDITEISLKVVLNTIKQTNIVNSPHLKNSKKLQDRQQLNIILLKLQNTKERYKEHIFAKIGMVIDKRVCLRQVGGFLWVLQFPPPIKLTATI